MNDLVQKIMRSRTFHISNPTDTFCYSKIYINGRIECVLNKAGLHKLLEELSHAQQELFKKIASSLS